VLDVVDAIPPGKVLTYGDVAELHGRGTGRTVGTVLSAHGREVPWQRVVQASGRPAEPHLQEALRLLRAEGCPLRGEVVVLGEARWDGSLGDARAPAPRTDRPVRHRCRRRPGGRERCDRRPRVRAGVPGRGPARCADDH
jgi:alkylated DNA nucleotide flippase Atl1